MFDSSALVPGRSFREHWTGRFYNPGQAKGHAMPKEIKGHVRRKPPDPAAAHSGIDEWLRRQMPHLQPIVKRLDESIRATRSTSKSQAPPAPANASGATEDPVRARRSPRLGRGARRGRRMPCHVRRPDSKPIVELVRKTTAASVLRRRPHDQISWASRSRCGANLRLRRPARGSHAYVGTPARDAVLNAKAP